MKPFYSGKMACLLLAAALGWTACGGNKPKDGDGGDRSDQDDYILQIDGDTAGYLPQLFYKTETPDAGIHDEVTKILFYFPRFEYTPNQAVRDSINQALQAQLLLDDRGELAYENIEERMNDFIERYQEDQTSGLGWGGTAKWSCEVQVEILANTPRIISLCFSENNFTGGAHGNNHRYYWVFDARTGRRLGLSDLLVGEREQLLPVAERFFRQKARIPAGKPLSETQYEFLSGAFELPDNVGVTRKSMLFYYQAYDLGINSDFLFEVPFKAIEPHLNKTYLR